MAWRSRPIAHLAASWTLAGPTTGVAGDVDTNVSPPAIVLNSNTRPLPYHARTVSMEGQAGQDTHGTEQFISHPDADAIIAIANTHSPPASERDPPLSGVLFL